MNDLIIFQNEEFGKIRMVEIDCKPYAVACDVAKALGYSIPHKAVRG
ncbi:BRO family, N-terminal domain [Alkalithermobacter thermoalcaliphilus JW-YL-7 = DSM 7308]|uniref:BRO family, N-terminal domain n=1 Tax=Alkalithermobacter thermoalcaliphilus JW-YL-7 = DSM 7308 TaxID=1121328 RepID=A0A150FSA1_CLOPD|nr:prophage antirepressor [[Clostridium] paradoxum JW-YL-7 = DSM 7308]SHL12492.1 BRO family, N-terminal domain [[Clostridium] paradoxum JW-YL-7 = DSM 7308]